MEEIWKFYKEVTNRSRWGHRVYEVSNKGNVKLNGIITEPHTRRDGYKYIGGFFVHRAVAELFIPNPDNKKCVDHIDTNKANNNEDNLRWCTHQENSNNPLTRKHNSESKKVAMNRPEVKQKHSEAIKESWSRPEVRQKIIEARKVANTRPEVKQNRSEAQKGKEPWNKNRKLAWVVLNGDQKQIKREELQKYLNAGWHRGRK